MTNNNIITKVKLIQYEQILELQTWKEVQTKVNTSILGEMDWYLIDGLLGDYLYVTKEKQSQIGDVEQLLKQCCDNEDTLQCFKTMVLQLEFS